MRLPCMGRSLPHLMLLYASERLRIPASWRPSRDKLLPAAFGHGHAQFVGAGPPAVRPYCDDIEAGNLLVGYLCALLIGILAQAALHGQAGLRGDAGHQLYVT